jgi:preprotein translocase subunit SecA
MMYDLGESLIERFQESSDYYGLKLEVLSTMGMDLPFEEDEFRRAKLNVLADKLFDKALDVYNNKTRIIGEKTLPVIENVQKNTQYENILIPFTDGRKSMKVVVNLKKAVENGAKEITLAVEKFVTLGLIDESWKEHLRELDELKHSVQNAHYEQKDPLLIYKFESFNLFKQMIQKINTDVISFLMRADVPMQDNNQVREQRARAIDRSKLQEQRTDLLAQSHSNTQERQVTQPIHVEKKVGRNDPCPCGSGKKYKNCHGAIEN